MKTHLAALAAGALLAAASPGAAQMTCTPDATGRFAQCAPNAAAQHQQMMRDSMARTNQMLADSNARRAAAAQQAAAYQAGQAQAAAAPPPEAADRKALRFAVAQAILDGDCQGAITQSLKAGDVDMASQARALCADLAARGAAPTATAPQ